MLIRATSNADGNVFAEFRVTVFTPVEVTEILLSETEISLEVGERVKKPAAEVSPDDATDKTLVWTISEESENPNAIVFVGTGFIEAVEAGNCKIIVSDARGNVSAEISVSVTE